MGARSAAAGGRRGSGLRRPCRRHHCWLRKRRVAGIAGDARSCACRAAVCLDRRRCHGHLAGARAFSRRTRLAKGATVSVASVGAAGARDTTPRCRDRPGAAASAFRIAVAPALPLGDRLPAAAGLGDRARLTRARLDHGSGGEGDAVSHSGTAGVACAGRCPAFDAAGGCARLRKIEVVARRGSAASAAAISSGNGRRPCLRDYQCGGCVASGPVHTAHALDAPFTVVCRCRSVHAPTRVRGRMVAARSHDAVADCGSVGDAMLGRRLARLGRQWTPSDRGRTYQVGRAPRDGARADVGLCSRVRTGIAQLRRRVAFSAGHPRTVLATGYGTRLPRSSVRRSARH